MVTGRGNHAGNHAGSHAGTVPERSSRDTAGRPGCRTGHARRGHGQVRTS
jgi:hypothetical protein